ncbi:hypothetical protein QBC47DRAFT_122636 [Echria macrotheca]|uniref:Uncharacterized protein n=1 Tax=Echria macrotheca TaxID=438768 RepID=A0AAJ0F6K5_9PEZI|nr:hypothetical protein QBC47DRAFT_122636 [Echria macrotheca]
MHTDHHHHRRILHSFRSHRCLRTEAGSGSQDMRHNRQPSDASSMARSSTESARPSTSRTDMSVEYDPLRLHPVTLAPGPVPILPTRIESRHYEPHELRQARSMHFHHGHHTQPRQIHNHSHSQSVPAMVIYGGFDFGFGEKMVPSSPSSLSGSEAATPNSCQGAFEWGDAITPRPHPAGSSSGPGNFIKRGDWKRRGIVFAADSPAASEDECFDLDM